MRNRKSIVAAALVCAAACGRLPGQTKPAAGKPKAPEPAAKLVRVDRAKRQVVVATVVQLQEGPLEFFLCSKGAKDHETVLVTNARPSSVHAGLLALGLMPGRPGRWVTPPAGGEAVFQPPRGPRLGIRLRWTDAKGKAREAAASDWLLMKGKKIREADFRWVFVGSDFLDDDRYWADVEGLFISLANFPASVIDVPFKSSDEAAFLEFVCAPKAVPPRGTKVDLVITVPKGQERAPVARINFTVDGFGRIRLDGVPIVPEAIEPAVKKFLARHAQGSADVRLDPRALVYDRDRLKAILADAGLTDVSFRTKGLYSEVLPRSPDQAAKALAWWKKQLAHARNLIIDPAEDAEEVLKHIRRRRKQLDEMSALWDDYAARLAQLLKEHRKANPPDRDKP